MVEEFLFYQAVITNFTHLPNLPKHTDECIHLIGGLLGHVYKYNPLKQVPNVEHAKWVTCFVPMLEHVWFMYLYQSN